MSESYVIEIRPPSVGVTLRAGTVVRDGDGFRFCPVVSLDRSKADASIAGEQQNRLL